MNNYFNDDEILLNPIYFIDRYELHKQDNSLKDDLNIKAFKEDKSGEFQPYNQNNSHVKGNASINSTVNTNAAVENSANEKNINYNISFFSFGDKQKKEERKELTQKSIEILNEFILEEEKIKEIEHIINENKEYEKNIKLGDIKTEIKINLNKIENNLNNYFKRPFMRKNCENEKILKKIIVGENQEDKKININDEIQKKNVTKDFEVNNLKEV